MAADLGGEDEAVRTVRGAAKQIDDLRSALTLLVNLIRGDIAAGETVSDSRRDALARADSVLASL
jgi:hypothetical protein